MTSEEIAIALWALLLAIFVIVIGAVVTAIAITNFIEARRARRKHKGASNERT